MKRTKSDVKIPTPAIIHIPTCFPPGTLYARATLGSVYRSRIAAKNIKIYMRTYNMIKVLSNIIKAAFTPGITAKSKPKKVTSDAWIISNVVGIPFLFVFCKAGGKSPLSAVAKRPLTGPNIHVLT